MTTRVRSGRLVIGTTPGNLSAKSPMFVAVSLPSLDRLRLQGDGNISATAINSRNLTVALPGSGNVHATGARRDDQRRGNRSAAPAHRATYGWSGGGPHALACAALLAGRCAAAATIAGVGPATAPDLDWLAGMGEGNVAEVAAARDGRERLTEYCRADADGIMAAGPEQLADAFRPHLSGVDSRALTGELAAFLLESTTAGLESGVDGWVDDDFAFLAPWGFDVEAIRVPVLVWQGGQDLMVPTDHARWLRQHVAGAEGGVLEDEGHLTLFADRVGDVHEWLRLRLS